VTGYDVSGGIFSDLSGGRSFVPVSNDFRLGKDVVLVPLEMASQMEEQAPGGLKGVANTVSESIKSAAKNMGESLQETAGTLADATKERQRAFVTGKTVSSDVATAEATLLSQERPMRAAFPHPPSGS